MNKKKFFAPRMGAMVAFCLLLAVGTSPVYAAFAAQTLTTVTPTGAADQPQGWFEVDFIVGPTGNWSPVGGRVALCWGASRTLTVFGPEDEKQVLFGDACRIFEKPVPTAEQIQALALWWLGALIDIYGPPWAINYAGGSNEPPVYEVMIPLLAK